jgi:hypothetical protein
MQGHRRAASGHLETDSHSAKWAVCHPEAGCANDVRALAAPLDDAGTEDGDATSGCRPATLAATIDASTSLMTVYPPDHFKEHRP